MSENSPTDNSADLRLRQGRDDDSTTSTSTGLRGPRGKTAQYYRDYRAWKRAEQESLNRISSTIVDSSTVAGSSKRRKSAAEYQREYRARKKAKRSINPQTTAGLSSSSDVGFAKPRRRKTSAEYQREYRARKKAQRESKRAAKTDDGSMEIADENTSNSGDENSGPGINPEFNSESPEAILPDIDQTQSYPRDQNIIIKQEIIETEHDPSTFDDLSATFCPPSSDSSFQDQSLTACPTGQSMSFHNSHEFSEPSTIGSSLISRLPVLQQLDTESMSSNDSTVEGHPKVTAVADDWNTGNMKSTESNPKIPDNNEVFVQKNDRFPLEKPPSANKVSKDIFDVYGEFIASKLRDLDARSCAFIQTAIADLIFEAELGRYLGDEEKSIFAARTSEFLKSMPLPADKEKSQLPSTIDSSLTNMQPTTPQLSGMESLDSSEIPRVQPQDQISTVGDFEIDESSEPVAKKPAYRKVFVKRNSKVLNSDHISSNDKSKLPKDKFDVFGYLIALKLTDLDARSCAFVQTAIADLIFEAELGRFLSDGEKSIFSARTSEFLKSMPSPIS